MTVRAGEFLLLNACMDAVALLLALRWCGQRQLRAVRVCAGAALGAAYALAAYLPGMGWARGFAPSLAVCAAMLGMAAKWRSPAQFLRAVLLFYGAVFLAGGTAYALAQALGGAPPVWAAGALGAWAVGNVLLRARRRDHSISRTRLLVGLGEQSAQVEGLVDSGNLLAEPISGLPVVVAPAAALAALLPQGLDPADLATLPPGFRLVRMVSPAGSALLMCFRPTALALWRQNRWAPIQAMVALSAHSPPEGALALVPGALVNL
ncbi:MAG: sigma-E processing peptidase SpoIIGA [Oscillospiraceae bacterium]|jgi:stage II sporulation protein GA (sporulation sigma-E factor processing peptidase)|nr:sigma-E processing peptidase SpoIIGA [Oscillospiraceae bacterium]